MLSQGGGAIVNTALRAGLLAVPALGAYIAEQVRRRRADEDGGSWEFANEGIRRSTASALASIRTDMARARRPSVRRTDRATGAAAARRTARGRRGGHRRWPGSLPPLFATGIALPVDAGSPPASRPASASTRNPLGLYRRPRSGRSSGVRAPGTRIADPAMRRASVARKHSVRYGRLMPSGPLCAS